MTIFWMDQAAIWAIIILSIYYLSRLSRDSIMQLMFIVIIAISIAYYISGDWTREYPTGHAALHVITSLGAHIIIAGIIP